MSKKLLQAAFLFGALGTVNTAFAQNSSVVPDTQYPTLDGSVMRPENSSASTMQKINGASGPENLYIHSWDGAYELSYYGAPNLHSGIAWRRTDANGLLLNEDFLFIKHARDIDAVIYEDGGDYYVLAAFYFQDINGAYPNGHYYNIYRFGSNGLTPLYSMNPLNSSGTFGRINVDASPYGLAITWCVPGVGLYAKTAGFPGVTFGPDVLLPGTSNLVDPDVCIRRGNGGSGTGLDLQIAALGNTLNQMFVYHVPFFDVLAGSGAGFTNEYTAVGSHIYCPPRIDCPDRWGGGQRWAVALGEYNYNVTTQVVTEWTYAIIKNEDWPGLPPTYTYPTTLSVNTASYTTSYTPGNNAVVAYNNQQDGLVFGWMSKQNTAVVPGTTKMKYLAVDIKDDGAAAPAVIPGSFNMITNTPCDIMPVLAFSGEERNSDYDGLLVAFSEYVPYPPFYNMKYKTRKWGLNTFTEQVKMPLQQNLQVSPNPFSNAVSFTVPAEGNYTISLTGLNGRIIYTHKEKLNAGQQFEINTREMAAGTYLMHITSPENKIKKTEKLVKL